MDKHAVLAAPTGQEAGNQRRKHKNQASLMVQRRAELQLLSRQRAVLLGQVKEEPKTVPRNASRQKWCKIKH